MMSLRLEDDSHQSSATASPPGESGVERMAQVPAIPVGYPQQPEQQQQQQQFPGQQPSYAAGGVPPVGSMHVAGGTPSMGTPGGMNMGTPGTLLPNGQFVPNNGGVPAPAYSTAPPAFAPSPGVQGGGGVVMTSGQNFAPAGGGGAQEQQQQQQPQQYVGVPPGMTRESLQPGYDPRVKNQKRVFNPEWSFRDSFGNRRGKNCCTVS